LAYNGPIAESWRQFAWHFQEKEGGGKKNRIKIQPQII
jgi:hypothetical protein